MVVAETPGRSRRQQTEAVSKERLGHLNFDSQQVQAFQETLGREKALKWRVDNGLMKYKKTRNPVLAESTIASSTGKWTEGPEEEEEKEKEEPIKTGSSRCSSRPPIVQSSSSRPRTSPEKTRRSTSRGPGDQGSTSRSSGSCGARAVHEKAKGGADNGKECPVTASSSSSWSSLGSLLSKCSATEEVVEEDLPLLTDPRLLPLACARPRELRKVAKSKEDFEGLRARRAERYLAKAHQRQQNNNQRAHEDDAYESNEVRSSSARPSTAPALVQASSSSNISTSRLMVERYGPAARGIPQAGSWKCVKNHVSVLDATSQLPTPWALHYYPPTSPHKEPQQQQQHREASIPPQHSSQGHGQKEDGPAVTDKRDRLLLKLQRRVGLILAKLSDVNARLDSIQRQKEKNAPAPGPQPRRAPPHFLQPTQASIHIRYAGSSHRKAGKAQTKVHQTHAER